MQIVAKNGELKETDDEYGARFQFIETKLAEVCQNERNAGSVADAQMMHMKRAATKSLVSKLEIFEGELKILLDSFTCPMNFLTAQVPEESKLTVAVRFFE